MSEQDVNLVEKATDAIGNSGYGQIADAFVETGESAVGEEGFALIPVEPAASTEDMGWHLQVYHEFLLPLYNDHLLPLINMVPWSGLLATALTLFFVIGGMNEIASRRG